MEDDLRELYQEVILDHGKNPRNFARPQNTNYEANGNNPLCGDKLTIFVKLGVDNIIEDVGFDGRGCAISIASASMMTDIVKGRSIEQVDILFGIFHGMCTGEDISEVPSEFEDDIDKLMVMSGVKQFPMRVKCATLGWHAMQAAGRGDEIASRE